MASFLSIPFPSSNEYRYPCQDCGKGFTDPAARIRHRKAAHGYQPYHTPEYYARRALKLKEAERRGKATLKKTLTGDQKASNVFPPSTQSAPSSSSSSANSLTNLLANTTYHDDFWKSLLNAPQRNASEPKVSQLEDARISTPVAAAPARDTPSTLHSDSDLYLPEVGKQPAATTRTGDEAPLCGYQWDTVVQPQSQASAQSWAAYGHSIPGPSSDHLPFPATLPTSNWQSTYPARGTTFQSLPTFSFTNGAVPSSMQNSFNSPTTSAGSSASSSHFSPNYIPTPISLEPVRALRWTPKLSPALSTPMTQTESFAGEPNRGFKTENFD